MYDVIIIGAGIIGSLVAKNLSKYQLKVLVLEKNHDVASEATSANSAIVHTGHDPKDDTLKAKYNVEGAKMYPQLCEELDCEIRMTGAYVIARNEEELEILDVLYQRAQSRGMNVSYVDRETMIQSEPNLSENIIKGISLPTTSVITPWEVAISAMELAMDNGVELKLDAPVLNIEKKDHFKINTPKENFESKLIINCAGAYADEIYRMVDADSSLVIHGHKGEYFVLDQMSEPFVQHVIYPIPSSMGKGILAVPTVHGNTLLGPNNIACAKGEVTTSQTGLDELRKGLSSSLKTIPNDKIIRSFSGIRPKGNTHDFVIEASKKVDGFINVAAIESPGIASAPAIAKDVVENLVAVLIDLTVKNHYQTHVREKIRLNKMSLKQRNRLAKENPQYAKIVCRCEQISEGEIVDVIHRHCGATTVKGIKKRIRPGMGRCQGGFCQPLVVEILARELDKSPDEILYDELNSELFVNNEKGVR